MRFFGVVFVLLGSLAAATVLGAEPEGPPASSPRWRLLVPAYFYPAGEGLRHWRQVEQAAERVPLAVVVNPASGPGNKPDANYRRVVRKLHRRAVLLGYVATGYGRRDAEEIRRDIDRWLAFYPGLRGFFFDEQSRRKEHLPFYAQVANYARARLPGAALVANPGTTFAPEYAHWRTADVYCIYEGSEFPSYLTQPRWTHLPGGAIPLVLWHGVGSAAEAKALLGRVALPRGSYVFVTDGGPPNPWNRLPRYWDELVRLLATEGKR